MNRKPVIGCWYKSPELPSIFEVVSYSDMDKSYEIQLFNGEISELDEDTWTSIVVRETMPPDDWTGALEVPSEELIEYLGYYHQSEISDIEITDRIEESFLH